VGAIYYFLKFDFVVQVLIGFSSLISIGYIAPILKNRKRLRDLPYLKIFLISFLWMILTLTIPLLLIENKDISTHILLGIERFSFVFAITIPFDIRDYNIEKRTKVITFPVKFGIKNSMTIAYFTLLISLITVWICVYFSICSWLYLLPILITNLLAYFIIKQSSPNKHDFYFTGLADGLMILRAALVFLLFAS